jgi:hypothetical protein
MMDDEALTPEQRMELRAQITSLFVDVEPLPSSEQPSQFLGAQGSTGPAPDPWRGITGPPGPGWHIGPSGPEDTRYARLQRCGVVIDTPAIGFDAPGDERERLQRLLALRDAEIERLLAENKTLRDRLGERDGSFRQAIGRRA